MNPNIHIITLGVKDLQRSLSFYRDGLGWKTAKASQDNIIFFQLNGIVLALYPLDALAEDIGIAQNEKRDFSGITLAYNAKSENEVDEVMQQVSKLGAKIIKPAQKAFWGGYSGYFADPDDHVWEVAHNPYFEFDSAGNLALS